MVKSFVPQRTSKRPAAPAASGPSSEGPAVSRDLSHKTRFQKASKRVSSLSLLIQKKFEEVTIVPRDPSDLSSSHYDELISSICSYERSPEWYRLLTDLNAIGRSLPSLILGSDKVVLRLMEALETPVTKPYAVDLAFAVLRDVGPKVYAVFSERVIGRLIGSMDVNDPAELERALFLLAAFFKFCIGRISAEVPGFFSLYLATLFACSPTKNICKLLGESAAYVYKRARDTAKIQEILTQVSLLVVEGHLAQRPQAFHFLSNFLFDLYRGIPEQSRRDLLVAYLETIAGEADLRNWSPEQRSFVAEVNTFLAFKACKIAQKNKGGFGPALNALSLQLLCKVEQRGGDLLNRVGLSVALMLSLFGDGRLFSPEIADFAKKILLKNKDQFAEESAYDSPYFLVLTQLLRLEQRRVTGELRDLVLGLSTRKSGFALGLLSELKLETQIKNYDIAGYDTKRRMRFAGGKLGGAGGLQVVFWEMIRGLLETFEINQDTIDVVIYYNSLYGNAKGREASTPLSPSDLENLAAKFNDFLGRAMVELRSDDLKPAFRTRQLVCFFFSIGFFEAQPRVDIDKLLSLLSAAKEILHSTPPAPTLFDFDPSEFVSPTPNTSAVLGAKAAELLAPSGLADLCASLVLPLLSTKHRHSAIEALKAALRVFPGNEAVAEAAMSVRGELGLTFGEKARLLAAPTTRRRQRWFCAFEADEEMNSPLESSKFFQGEKLVSALMELDALPVGFDNERSICETLANFSLEVGRGLFTEPQKEVLFFFALSYLFERYNGVKEATMELLHSLCVSSRRLFAATLKVFAFASHYGPRLEFFDEATLFGLEAEDLGLQPRQFGEFLGKSLAISGGFSAAHASDFFHCLSALDAGASGSRRSESCEATAAAYAARLENRGDFDGKRDAVAALVAAMNGCPRPRCPEQRKALKALLLRLLARDRGAGRAGLVALYLKLEEEVSKLLKTFFSRVLEKGDLKDKLLDFDPSTLPQLDREVYSRLLRALCASMFFSAGKDCKTTQLAFSRKNFLIDFMRRLSASPRELLGYLLESLDVKVEAESLRVSLASAMDVTPQSFRDLAETLRLFLKSFRLQLADFAGEFLDLTLELAEFLASVRDSSASGVTRDSSRLKSARKDLVETLYQSFQVFSGQGLETRLLRVLTLLRPQLGVTSGRRLAAGPRFLLLFSGREEYKPIFLSDFSQEIFEALLRNSRGKLAPRFLEVLAGLLTLGPVPDDFPASADPILSETRRSGFAASFAAGVERGVSFTGLSFVEANAERIVEELLAILGPRRFIAEARTQLWDLVIPIVQHVRVTRPGLNDKFVRLLGSFLRLKQPAGDRRLDQKLKILELLAAVAANPCDSDHLLNAEVAPLLLSLDHPALLQNLAGVLRSAASSAPIGFAPELLVKLADSIRLARKLDEGLDFDAAFEFLAALKPTDAPPLIAPLLTAYCGRFMTERDLSVRGRALQCLEELLSSPASSSPTRTAIFRSLDSMLALSAGLPALKAVALASTAAAKSCGAEEVAEWGDLNRLLTGEILDGLFSLRIEHRVKALETLKATATEAAATGRGRGFVASVVHKFVNLACRETRTAHKLEDAGVAALSAVVAGEEPKQLMSRVQGLVGRLDRDQKTVSLKVKLCKGYLGLVLAKSDDLDALKRLQRGEGGRSDPNLTVIAFEPRVARGFFELQEKIKSMLRKTETLASFKPLLTEALLSLARLRSVSEFLGELSFVVRFLAREATSPLFKSKKLALKTFIRVARTCGPKLLKHIFNTLKNSSGEGVPKHASVYIAWLILDSCLRKDDELENEEFIKEGLADAASAAFEFVMIELAEDTQEEKQNDQLRKKSTYVRGSKAAAIAELLASRLDPRSELLRSFIARLCGLCRVANSFAETLRRCKQVSTAMSRGVGANPRLTGELAMSLAFGLLSERVDSAPTPSDSTKTQTIAEAKRAAAEDRLKVQDGASTGTRPKAGAATSRVPAIEGLKAMFAMQLVTDFLASSPAEEKPTYLFGSESVFDELRVFVAGEDLELAQAALKAMKALIDRGLWARTDTDALFKSLVSLLAKAGRGNLDLIDSIFQLLCFVFEVKVPRMTRVEYDILFHSLGQHLSESSASGRNLLRVLINARFIQPQIYDCMLSVLDTLVLPGLSPSTADELAQLFADFARTFPVTAELLGQACAKLAANCEFAESTAARRAAVSRLLAEVLRLSPPQALQSQFNSILLQLATARVNELHLQSRETLDAALTALLDHLCGDSDNFWNVPEAATAWGFTETFLKSENPKLLHAALVLISTFLRCRPANLRRILKSQVLDRATEVLSELSQLAKFALQGQEGAVQARAALAEKETLAESIAEFCLSVAAIDPAQSQQLSPMFESLRELPYPALQMRLLSASLQHFASGERSEEQLGEVLIATLSALKRTELELEKTGFFEDLRPILAQAAQDSETLQNVLAILFKLVANNIANFRENELIILRTVRAFRLLIDQVDPKTTHLSPVVKFLAKLKENSLLKSHISIQEILEDIYQRFSNCKGTAFLEEYRQESSRLESLRRERKEERARLAITDPQKHAEIKRQRVMKERRRNREQIVENKYSAKRVKRS